MKNAARSLFLVLICLACSRAWGVSIRGEIESIAEEKPEAVSLNLIEMESSYVLGSDLHRSGSFGDQDALQNSLSYGHRILLNGNLYLHLGIDYAVLVGFFSYAVLVAYIAFIPPESARSLILAARDRLTGLTLPGWAPLARRSE